MPTRELAAQVESVVIGASKFTNIRCTQSVLDQVNVAIGGDDGRLPYLDSILDVVVMNLVLEWCAARNPQETFAEVRQRVLSECCCAVRRSR